ncbi:DUF2059 domain-containing protein [Sphingomonas sp. JC676]|uniref:DUF2059 domain-containing protein n=1 Tax=Sphingomonas sp. JC676 TaxID=2768065 RepID=UPI00165823FA|nr:DUF2059 domain-containing protein [Sphingomonas sp. JC676]MBC9034421.1 DUF2059 domain-containing protein [Sphingomonas sp. JC676]
MSADTFSVRFALLFLAAVAGNAVVATAPASAQAIDPARKVLGVELARLLNSEEITRAQGAKMIAQTFPQALAADPDLKMAEQAYPGVIKALLDAVMPAALEQTIQRLPLLWDRIGTLYAQNLTDAEIRAALQFYRSPAGAKVIQVMTAETDFSAAVKESIESEDNKISTDSLRKGLTTGMDKLGDRLTADEQAAVVRFAVTPAGSKAGALAPRIQALAVEWANESENSAQLQKLAIDTVQKFIAEHGEKE